jgi:hypothetical protein
MLLARTSLVAVLMVIGGCASEEPASWSIPGATESLAIERFVAHAFLAEYHRDLVLHRGGVELSRIGMTIDTGGYSRANIYPLATNTLLVSDYDCDYVVDITTGVVRVADGRLPGDEYLGSFDEDSSRAWRFIPSSERGEVAVGPPSLASQPNKRVKPAAASFCGTIEAVGRRGLRAGR